MDEIIEQIFRGGRLYVRIENGGSNGKVIPRANYVWLKYNISFAEIPKGYVVHHLDHDPLNDDISNLAIMDKAHHSAHHWKQVSRIVPVSIQNGSDYRPIRIPKVSKRNDRKTWCVRFWEKTDSGSKRERNLYSNQDKEPLITREMAEKYANYLWEIKKSAES